MVYILANQEVGRGGAGLEILTDPNGISSFGRSGGVALRENLGTLFEESIKFDDVYTVPSEKGAKIPGKILQLEILYLAEKWGVKHMSNVRGT